MSRKYGDSHGLYHLIMTNSSPWYRRPIKIDGLPFLKMVDFSMAMLNNRMVKWEDHGGYHGSLASSDLTVCYFTAGMESLHLWDEIEWVTMGYYIVI